MTDNFKDLLTICIAILIGLAMICATIILSNNNWSHASRDKGVACFSHAKTRDDYLACQGIEP